jgi:hypothetical protein
MEKSKFPLLVKAIENVPGTDESQKVGSVLYKSTPDEFSLPLLHELRNYYWHKAQVGAQKDMQILSFINTELDRRIALENSKDSERTSKETIQISKDGLHIANTSKRASVAGVIIAVASLITSLVSVFISLRH